MTADSSSNRRKYLVAGAVCGLACIYLTWLALANLASLRVPPAIALLAAAVFGLAAGRLLQMYRRPAGEGDGFGALILAVFAAIGGWIALSPNAQACTVGLNGVPMGETAGAACRVPFGAGAVIAAAMAVYAAARWKKKAAIARRP